MSFSVPPKKVSSVRLERAEAPLVSYLAGLIAASVSAFIQPLEGDFRLNSAMIPQGQEANEAFMLIASDG